MTSAAVGTGTTAIITGKTFGSSGIEFDGNSDYLTIPASGDWSFGTADWTIEFWAFHRNTSRGIGWEMWAGGNGHIQCGTISGSKVLQMAIKDQAGTSHGYNHDLTNIWNQWNHFAFGRHGNNIYSWINGIRYTHTNNPPASGDTFGASNRQVFLGAGDGAGTFGDGFMDGLRVSKGIARYTTADFSASLPTEMFGATATRTLPTITLTGAATQLAADEDIEFTSVINTTKAANNQHLTDSGIGLTLTNLTGGDKNKATLTGTIASAASTTHTNMAVKAQVRQTLGNAAYANASRVVTFSSSTTTAGAKPAVVVELEKVTTLDAFAYAAFPKVWRTCALTAILV
jgi:hypothetical protein